MVNHPHRSNPILALVSSAVARRHRITRNEMRSVLDDLWRHKVVELDNGWQTPRQDGDHAQAWADMCTGITVISILANDDSPVARNASSNPGSIRYDDPGSMHPLMRPTLIFAPASLADLEYDQIGQLRRRARRVLVVEGAE
jgi:hypothetical protein